MLGCGESYRKEGKIYIESVLEVLIEYEICSGKQYCIDRKNRLCRRG